MEGDMPIRESFKILVIVYLFIYVLQCFSMLIASKYYLITVNILDGWVKGGISLLAYEVATDVGFPHGESLSSGFILSFESLIKWPLALTLGVLTFSPDYNEQGSPMTDSLKPLFIVCLALYLLCNVTAIILISKSPFQMKRAEADLAPLHNGMELEVVEEDEDEEDNDD